MANKPRNFVIISFNIRGIFMKAVYEKDTEASNKFIGFLAMFLVV